MSAPKFQDQCVLGSPGSARVSRAGFGVSPKQSSRFFCQRDLFANMPDAYSTRKPPLLFPGSAGCQPAAFGRLPSASAPIFPVHANQVWRQAAANYRLAACAPQNPQ
ncbi:MAG: hypothetical protein DMF19_13855 [Verrucomicrobia bacterium]|nr:MAG: hypothetical protein DMF19_13855 [Verrucomicrobiota bacterium]